MHLHHVTLNTGHSRRLDRQEISSRATDIAAAWLRDALRHQEPMPLMHPFEAYNGQALTSDGALVVTLYGRAPQVGQRLPLLSFAVATRSRHGHALWDAMLKGAPQQVLPNLARPPAPWCAATFYPTVASDPDALSWAADFEGCVAWAWLSRHPDIKNAT